MKSISDLRKAQRRMNPQTLDALAAKGSNLGKPHQIINVFNIFSYEHVSEIVKKLEELKYSIPDGPKKLTDDETDTDYWLVEAVFEIVPSVEDLNRMTDECVDVAFGLDADYDGWYTEVIPVIH